MIQTPEENQTTTWLAQPVSRWLKTLDLEKILYIVIILLAILTRMLNLGDRVMAHDEVNHVIPSLELYEGKGYRHDPVTHGPLQFHLIALSYTLFGDTDFDSRLPHAIFSIATICLVWKYRRYLGKLGALLAAVMMLIDPFMMFYGRYARNESFIAFFALLLIYFMLRYMEEPLPKYLFGLAAVLSLMYCTKEVSFIYTAQALIFLVIVFLKNIFGGEWKVPRDKRTFLVGMISCLIFVGAFLYLNGRIQSAVADTGTSAATLAVNNATPSITGSVDVVPQSFKILLGFTGILAVVGLVVAIFYLFRGYGEDRLRADRSFDLLLFIISLILPQLTAFPVKFLGWNPLDYSNTGMLHTGIVLVVMLVISVALGMWWNRQTWWKAAAIFYAIYIFFYTTMFTNGQGFFTGIIGSLGYWLSQQGVNRGSQPLYYYALVQIPVYEFLSAIGCTIGLVYAIRRWMLPDDEEVEAQYRLGEDAPEDTPPLQISEQLPVWLLIFWAFSSLVAYSFAGEKMPWLTVHIAWPMILLAGWAFGRMFSHVDWKKLLSTHGATCLICTIILVIGLGRVMAAFNSTPLPFSGNEIEQLSATSGFLFSIAMILASLAGMFYLNRLEPGFRYGQFLGVVIIAALALLTARASYRASFVLYDTAREYLVYAHAARGPLDILDQVEEISERVTGGKNLRIGYDGNSNYPYWWYLRDYTNLHFFGEQPTKDILNDDIVIAGNPLYSKVDPILSKDYYSFEYVRLWWPNQDYFNLDWPRVKNAITDPDIRAGIFDIWLNRDYTKYAAATHNENLTDITWEPAERMKLYIRKDLAAKMWNYGAAPVVTQPVADPYEAGKITLPPDQVWGTVGAEVGQLNTPRGIAVGADDSVYVVDTGNNRIQHFSAKGDLLGEWGSFADASQGNAPGGTFNEPWGIAVGPDGSVYVTDTWNYRIQKFTADGEFITMWGHFGQDQQADSLYGPRGIGVDSQSRVYVTDTGNKRVVVFSGDGEPLTTFGSYGMDPGQFDEPVGIALDSAGNVYVADTWNQRVQVFSPQSDGLSFAVSHSWDISGWAGQSLENKPFLTVDSIGNVFVTDPEGYRVIEFGQGGEFLRTWGDYSPESDGFGLASGIAADHSGGIWVSDSANSRLLHFKLQ